MKLHIGPTSVGYMTADTDVCRDLLTFVEEHMECWLWLSSPMEGIAKIFESTCFIWNFRHTLDVERSLTNTSSSESEQNIVRMHLFKNGVPSRK